MFVIATGVVGVMLVTWGSWRLVRQYRRWREPRRPGYIVAWHVDETRNGYPRYYTYEMRRPNRLKRRA